jgi:hypothetical protein
MANQEHLDILAKGVETWNAWRGQHLEARPDLRGAVLSKAILSHADLRAADMSGADLTRADVRSGNLNRADLRNAILRHAILRHADLRQADLHNANLHGAVLSGVVLLRADLSAANLAESDLSRADLRGVNLFSADLSGAVLSGAELGGDLRNANFDRASFGHTYFANVDLSEAKGLDTARHLGPSPISVDTIYRSHGKVPESFLRGCGVPENFITYVKSLTGAALDFYSVFISYSTKDQTFADRLHVDLQARGVRCWFAPHDIRGGRKIHEQIDEAIRVYDKLLLILSNASMTSDWVGEEIARARKRERNENRRMLFPISIVPYDAVRDWQCFDADAGKDSAREVREYFIPDFSEWKEHDAYSRAFERLVQDLKAGRGTERSGIDPS